MVESWVDRRTVHAVFLMSGASLLIRLGEKFLESSFSGGSRVWQLI